MMTSERGTYMGTPNRDKKDYFTAIVCLLIGVFLITNAYLVGIYYPNIVLKDKITQLEKENNSQYEYLKSVTVRILAGYKGESQALGTGIVIKTTEDYTYILTNAHVAKMRDEVPNCDGLYTEDCKTGKLVEVVRISDKVDLAVVKVAGKIEGKQVIRGYADEIIGEKVDIVGQTLGLEYIYTHGTVGGKLIEENGKEHLFINCGAMSGNSGSGIFNKDGKLIGLLWGGITESTGGDWAVTVTIEDIKEFIKQVLE